MAELTDNSPTGELFLQMPASYAGTELPASWRSRYGKKDGNGAYVYTTFAMLSTDPEVKIPNKKIAVAPNIYMCKMVKGFTQQMLSQIITGSQSDPNVGWYDWTDARAKEIAAREAGIE